MGIKMARYSNLFKRQGESVIRTELQPIRYKNDKPSVAIYRDQGIYVTGGDSYSRRNMKIVMRYSIKNDKWDVKLPSMNEGRSCHGSCFMRNQLYCFGGRRFTEDWDNSWISSIEFLDVIQQNAKWNLIALPVG